MSMLSYQHFPIYAIMVLFFGAFLVIMLGRNKALRNTIALLAVTASLALLIALIKPVMVDGEMDLGEFGRIHFIDWDQTRARKRTVQVMLIGE